MSGCKCFEGTNHQAGLQNMDEEFGERSPQAKWCYDWDTSKIQEPVTE